MSNYPETVKFIDLFCGIGGFRARLQRYQVKSECVFSSDIDLSCQDAYKANFNHRPVGDITKIQAKDIPDHDILLAGFHVSN